MFSVERFVVSVGSIDVAASTVVRCLWRGAARNYSV